MIIDDNPSPGSLRSLFSAYYTWCFTIALITLVTTAAGKAVGKGGALNVGKPLEVDVREGAPYLQYATIYMTEAEPKYQEQSIF